MSFSFGVVGCGMLESADTDPIYSEKIDGVTISSDSGTELLKSASATLTATVEAVHAKEDALSYSWSISQGSEYASLSSASDATTKITMSDSALEEEVVTVSCTVSYNFGECNTITSSIDIIVGQSGTVNAHFDMLCGEKTWTYYTDSSFTNAVTGALTDKQAEAVETGYFKPTTMNSDGKPRATLVGYKFMRTKLGGSKPGMVGYEEMTGKKTSNLNWDYFKEKGSYLKLHVYGDCKVTITGGAAAAADYRGVWVYDSNGEEVAEISNTTELTERSFDAALNDEFYIVGNSGGVTAIDCESENEDEEIGDTDIVTNAVWAIDCGSSSFTYYSDSAFTNAITGALSNSTAVAGPSYFKPTTTNSDGNPNATLYATKFLRVKLNGSGTALLGCTPGSGLNSADVEFTKTKLANANVSCMVLTVGGNCSVSITGGSTGSDVYRAVLVYDSDGTEKASIKGQTTLTTVDFSASAGESYYIYGSGGGVTNITCTSSE